MVKRVFIQAYCRYPHGGALSNYIENLAKAISNIEYDVILAVDINKEYEIAYISDLSKPIIVIPIVPSENEFIRQNQKASGYSDERMGVLKEYNIGKDDSVIVLGIQNEYFLDGLFEYGKKIGFKIICGVLELFEPKDFTEREQYEKNVYVKDVLYMKSDAILSISEYIDQHYINKGMKVFRLPPMVDYNDQEKKIKEMNKYRFIIPSPKDSLKSMLEAFGGLNDEELRKIEIHLCGIMGEHIREIISQDHWGRLKKCIVIHPWMYYEALLELYKKMHFLLIARNICQRTLANFPSKVPECMAYGIVPIVSDVGDYTKYYLRDGEDSIFIDGDSEVETRKSIRKAIGMNSQEYICYSQNACKTVKNRFDYRVWSTELKRIIESV